LCAIHRTNTLSDLLASNFSFNLHTFSFFNKTLGDVDGAAARFGDWKIITGYGCGGNMVWQEWPELSDKPVSLGYRRVVVNAVVQCLERNCCCELV
jgi:hypothetical protein